ELGSAAAPTAGLHFTEEILSKIKEKGITICNVTLNIGLGTFKGVSEENIEDHKMHTEYFRMSKETAEILNNAKKENKRIIAVGTTSVRTIESIYGKYKKFVECAEDTNIFIYPGYEFLVTDALITNFHLPKSTLVMLVSAFSSKDIILNAYKEAINNKYRFFSFGDAMFIR
ncbi:MAG: S-adenosylmethionine:tRNA ribosyltransferase-isomerase, partial [Bacilli bacterium]